ncbi:bifunctional lysylphosphatidylglycerol flippase/synthetase MprF [Streptococcus iniae]|uniref:bifunctional lysylphosphatidylglycerol flippase/synthetase MprF n=1 Tax=Streptococcus iniae TaxID=1346 RepID=UPI002B2F1BEF|nr:bifunctional lysylphosphatidylglycerol flippase/synthetase MprF [Streptococcus iniae]WNZ90246.1 bifunctional lysylphosphatidylglycerol flippase/synthetase MprF [Streptococcus iniae]WNZ91879.1 bifunctional lysylphosphatidylglycerol flippase/synthetase MprF [Streptococcus iniae]WNZ93294.1 bifunctional lysylphosphatidylglycerol flippase/synthetase MprF [Streptococcus iniae]WNZ96284.1 bifunctional lysylphosphatidylglycerol flippase/synthetase MprF [Streptococcus iniae]
MKKLITNLKNYQSSIKLVFFLSVSMIVILELGKLIKTISIADIKNGLSQLTPFSIVIMFVLGICALIPMLFFDIILNQEIKSKHSLVYILETSWIINSINNLVGFAGLVDIGLRYSFYSEDDKASDSMQGISKVIPFFITGLSFLSLLTFLLIFCFPTSPSIEKFWIVLLGASLYLPVVLYISGHPKLKFFGQLARKRQLQLIMASTLDWLVISGFFTLIGRFLDLEVPLYNLIPLFFISMILGMVSMIPGGLGSFDLIMTAGLVNLGYATDQVLTWILLFRFFYYVIPFVIGGLLFFKQMGGKLNDNYLGMPKTIGHIVLQNGIVFFLRVFGYFMILSALIPEEIAGMKWLAGLNPIQGHLLWQFPSILLGSLFFLLARFVKRQLAISYPLAIGLFLTTIIYINLGNLAIPTTVLLGLAFLMVIIIKKRLNRQVFIYSWEDKTRDALVFMATFVTFFSVGGKVLIHAFPKLNQVQFNYFLFYWLHLFFLAFILVAVYQLVIRRASRKKWLIGQSFDKERYQALLERFKVQSDDASLAFLGDKRLFWYRNHDEDCLVFQFAVKNNKCIVMGEPIGDKSMIEEGLSAFIKEAKLNNMKVVFYEVGQETTLALHEFGYEFIKFGETAHVNLSQFSLEGRKGKKFRTIVNKIDHKGYQFEVVKPPFSEAFLEELNLISEDWLQGRQEKGYSVGFFDKAYLQLAPIAIVRREDGSIIAFTNLLPTNSKEESSVDLMRYYTDQSQNGIMDFLFIKLFLYFKEEGVAYFDLGMAPLANVGNKDNSFLQEKIAYLIFAFSTRFYSFGGLRQYKQKFSPEWSARYIVYPKTTWLLYDLLAIYQVESSKIKDCSQSCIQKIK